MESFEEHQLSPASDLIGAKSAAYEAQMIGASILGKLDAQGEYLTEVTQNCTSEDSLNCTEQQCTELHCTILAPH